MIVMHSESSVRSESRADALDLFRELGRNSRAEAGVIDYRVTVDAEDPTTVHIFEQYADAEAANAHESSDHLAAFLAAIEPHLEGESVLKRFEVVSETTHEGP
jgi:quinol monooxygenase YgiN